MDWRSTDQMDGRGDIRSETVIAPVAHEGIARALRGAFQPRRSDLPADWRGLLDRLDR